MMGIFSLISITSSQTVKKYPSNIHFIFAGFFRGSHWKIQKNILLLVVTF